MNEEDLFPDIYQMIPHRSLDGETVKCRMVDISITHIYIKDLNMNTLGSIRMLLTIEIEDFDSPFMIHAEHLLSTKDPSRSDLMDVHRALEYRLKELCTISYSSFRKLYYKNSLPVIGDRYGGGSMQFMLELSR